jgi:tetratricopeptide (TPR) repeat protein
MPGRTKPLASLLGTLLAVSLLMGQDTVSPRSRFELAVDLAAGGEIRRAISEMEEVLEVYSEHEDVLWNLGIWYSRISEHSKAILMWERYRQIAPRDWQARAKLIQAYQALGRIEERDTERTALIAWYKETGHTMGEVDLFCREQFLVDQTRFMAFERFAPLGDRKIFFIFAVVTPEGTEAFRYSLGSYEETTLVARELGEIGAQERVYHLDQYGDDYHSTIAFFHTLPTYEQLREQVVAAFRGQRG